MNNAEMHSSLTLPLMRIWTIAATTLTELIRSRVFYFLGIFALIVLGAGSFLSDFSFEEQIKVLKDTSLGSMSIFTTVLAIAATAMLIPNDIEDRTLYTILAKPITRFEYLLGKIGGVFLLLLVLVALMTMLMVIILVWREQQVLETVRLQYAEAPAEALQQALAEAKGAVFNPTLFYGVILIYVKSCLIATICLALSSMTNSAIFTILCTTAVYFIGHVQVVARSYYQERFPDLGVIQQLFLDLIALVFPDLNAFNLSDEINAGTVLPPDVFGFTICLGLVYMAFYMLLAFLIFNWKEV